MVAKYYFQQRSMETTGQEDINLEIRKENLDELVTH